MTKYFLSVLLLTSTAFAGGFTISNRDGDWTLSGPYQADYRLSVNDNGFTIGLENYSGPYPLNVDQCKISNAATLQSKGIQAKLSCSQRQIVVSVKQYNRVTSPDDLGENVSIMIDVPTIVPGTGTSESSSKKPWNPNPAVQPKDKGGHW